MFDALFRQTYQLILAAERILLVADGRPDGDSIGSTTAVYTWLQALGKRVEAFCIEPIPSHLRFLDGAEAVSHDPAIFQHPFDLVLTFDASDPVRSGLTANLPLMATPAPVVVFDHHATNPHYGTLNIIDTSACSTCELVYTFLHANHVSISARSATSLLTGILTDTSSFSNAGTTIIGMQAASELMRAGARLPHILHHQFRSRHPDALKLWGRALERLHLHPDWHMLTTYFTAADIDALPNGAELAEGLSNFLNATCNATQSLIVLRETSTGHIKGSVRSVSEDISIFAQSYGGGGHKKAAGFMVKGKLEVKDGIAYIVKE